LNFRRLVILPFLLTAILLNIDKGCASSWQQTGSVRVSTEYDTNPLMSPTNPDGVWRNMVEPGYALTGTFDRDELRTGLALEFSRSSNETLSPNRNSPTAFLDWLHQGEAGEFGISSRYAETTTRNADTGNTDPGLANNTRTSRSVSGRWSNALSERSTLSAEGSYESVFYSGGTFVNYATRSAGMMFSYVWNEASTPFLRMLHTEYEPAGSTTVPSSFSNTVIAGLNWQTSESLEGTVQIGKSRISNAEMSTQGGASVRYTTERNLLALSADRQVSPSGLGGLTTVDQANGSWSYELNERSRTGINLGWRMNRFVTDIISRTAGVWLQHELSSFWSLRTYYMRNMINAEGVEGAYSNILGVNLSYTHTDF